MKFKQWLESQQIAKDHDGQDITDLVGNPLYTNPDGTVDIYHATNKQAYNHIVNTEKWTPAGYETDVFFSNFPRGGEGFGDYVVHVRILPRFLRVDDSYRNGEIHLAINHKVLQKFGKIITQEKNSLKTPKPLPENWNDFLTHHKTGWIHPDAYEQYEKDGGLAWLGPKTKYPKLLATKQYGPYTVEFRQSKEKLQYTKTDDEGNIVRDDKGLAQYMSPEEMKTKGLRQTDATIVAFINDEPIGHASNEFGTTGVWVEKRYQKLGIGSDLLVMFMEDNPKFLSGKSKIGQMTNAGESMTKSAYRKLTQKYGPDWFKKD